MAISVAGLAALAALLTSSGDLVYGTFGFALFAVGGTVWLVAVAWRRGETELTGTVPVGTEGWSEWFGVLHSIHLLSAYVSWVFLGSGVVSSGILPEWVGWLGVGLGAAGAVGVRRTQGWTICTAVYGPLVPVHLGNSSPCQCLEVDQGRKASIVGYRPSRVTGRGSKTGSR